MAITISKLSKNAVKLYNMKLVAGEKGLNNLVQWVHIIEDEDVSKFLHGQEFVLTTGVLLKDSEELFKFVKKLYEIKVSAILVNIGPHISEISKEVIEYCNEIGMPLFTVPWDVPLVDVTRELCSRIVKNDTVEEGLASTIKNIIFKMGDVETQIHQLERNGIDRDSNFTFAALKIDEDTDTYQQEKSMERLRRCCEEVGRNINEVYLSFKHKGALIVVLVDYSFAQIQQFVNDLKRIISWEFSGYANQIKIGISQEVQGITKQEENLEKAIAAMNISNKEKNIIFYDELDIYKLLISVKDKSVLLDCYNDTIGKIIKYDKENNTNLKELVESFIRNNGSHQNVANEMYVHRNTVNNQLKKIEKIIGLDPNTIESQVKMYLGLRIESFMI